MRVPMPRSASRRGRAAGSEGGQRARGGAGEGGAGEGEGEGREDGAPGWRGEGAGVCRRPGPPGSHTMQRRCGANFVTPGYPVAEAKSGRKPTLPTAPKQGRSATSEAPATPCERPGSGDSPNPSVVPSACPFAAVVSCRARSLVAARARMRACRGTARSPRPVRRARVGNGSPQPRCCARDDS